jgi:exodeoxyribonuclease V gamma subunit
LPVSSITPGLIIVHSNQTESLRDVLLTWMRRNPLAPLENEVVLVQSSGMAQWLKLAMAADTDKGGGGHGIAAALDISMPANLLWRAYQAVLGKVAVPAQSPFDKEALSWRLMRLLPVLVNEPAYAPLRHFLADDEDGRKRFQLGQRLADLFDKYQVYRADWLAAWAIGADELPQHTGKAKLLPDTQAWQPALWRALIEDLASTTADTAPTPSRAAVHTAFMQALEQWPADRAAPKLPRRIAVFGLSSLPRQSLEALAALARWVQIVICVNNPCEHYWADIVPDRALLGAGNARQCRRIGTPDTLTDETMHRHAHPLLAAWGRQGRDFIGMLDEYDQAPARRDYTASFAKHQLEVDLFRVSDCNTLLQQLQDDVRALRPVHESRATWPAVDTKKDHSIRFHVAHSRQREVEILHDQLLAAFDKDATLKTRDVIVMVPAVDDYAAHIQSVFGLLPTHSKRYIPFSIANPSPRQTDPLLNAVAQLLGLAQSRLKASEVIELLDLPALRTRFGIRESELPLLRRWIDQANIRWGLHDAHRQSLSMPASGSHAAPHTWQFGLRRMLLGYAVGDTGSAWQDIEPFDDIGGLEAAALGRLVQLIDQLERTWKLLRESASPDDWTGRFRQLLRDFFLPEDIQDKRTMGRLNAALRSWQAQCAAAGLTDVLTLAVAAEHWLAQMEEGDLTQRFLGGGVTFATLMPMRALPFRRVYMLGMNDGDYPRSPTPMDFDLMQRDYRPGDRSRREDDRYLFLEALLSAREHLHISWVGRSIHDNSHRPPSVLVTQLRDHLAAGWGLESAPAETAKAMLAAMTVEHPLQPFSASYFGTPDDSPLFTYAREWERTGDEHGESSSAPLALIERDTPLTIEELSAFLKAPVKAFFTKRLKVHLDLKEASASDAEPFVLDGLDIWTHRNKLIKAEITGRSQQADAVQIRTAMLQGLHRQGNMPAGEFGKIAGEALEAPLADLFEQYGSECARWPECKAHLTVRIDVALKDRTITVTDTLRELRVNDKQEYGRVVISSSNLVEKNKFKIHNMLPFWLSHLVAQADGKPSHTVVISPAGDIEFLPIEQKLALDQLADYVAAWQEGMHRPLPFAVKTANTWLSHALPGRHAKADNAYVGDRYTPGEITRDASLQRMYPDFDSLIQGGEFERWAERILLPLRKALDDSKQAKADAIAEAKAKAEAAKAEAEAQAKAAKAEAKAEARAAKEREQAQAKAAKAAAKAAKPAKASKPTKKGEAA